MALSRFRVGGSRGHLRNVLLMRTLRTGKLDSGAEGHRFEPCRARHFIREFAIPSPICPLQRPSEPVIFRGGKRGGGSFGEIRGGNRGGTLTGPPSSHCEPFSGLVAGLPRRRSRFAWPARTGTTRGRQLFTAPRAHEAPPPTAANACQETLALRPP
jgi:hypothetical protein